MAENISALSLAEEQIPYQLEAEQSVLGAILVDSSCLSMVMDELRSDSFHRPEHARLFEIMVRLFTTAQPIDHITVLDHAISERIFPSEADARAYLVQLIQIVPSTKNITAYARIVREKYYARSLMHAAHEILDNVRSGDEDAGALMDSAEQRIYDIRQGRSVSGLKHIGQVLLDIYDRLQRLSGDEREQYVGIPTDFSGIDRIMTGLNRSDLILIAGRPGMGKTSFILNIATNVAFKRGRTVAIFTLEMSREQIVERMLSADARIQGNKLRTGELSNDDWVRLAVAAQQVAQAPIYIDDTASITVPEMKARLRRMRDVDLCIIDYLQLMSGTTRSDNRVAVISEITRSLKVMAKDLNIPVILCSQLSRGPESRTDHRPLLSDLRESGSIEQDADSVLFLYRDAYYNRESTEQNVAECIVAKNRHGETGIVKLGWDGEHTRFSSLEMFRSDP